MSDEKIKEIESFMNEGIAIASELDANYKLYIESLPGDGLDGDDLEVLCESLTAIIKDMKKEPYFYDEDLKRRASTCLREIRKWLKSIEGFEKVIKVLEAFHKGSENAS